MFLSGCGPLVVDSLTAHGNLTDGLRILGCAGTTVSNSTFNAGSLACPIGISVYGGWYGWLTNCSFGATTPHATGDICVQESGTTMVYVNGYNNLLASTVEVANQGYMTPGSRIFSHIHDQQPLAERVFSDRGVSDRDATIKHVLTASRRITPLFAAYWALGSLFHKPVKSGRTATFVCWVRCSQTPGDAATYNGALPRMVLAADPAAGIPAEVVLATATAASAGAWERLSGTSPVVSRNTVLGAMMEGKGTTGWLSVEWGDEDFWAPDAQPMNFFPGLIGVR
jgi:hypothetical protein